MSRYYSIEQDEPYCAPPEFASPKLCACGNLMHKLAQGPHCAFCERDGYAEELKRGNCDMETQAEFAFWQAICLEAK